MLSSARLLSSACWPGTQAPGLAPSGHVSSSAWLGLHLRHTPWGLDTRSCHTRQTRAQHTHQDRDSHHAAQRTRLMATQTDAAGPGDGGAGVPLWVPGCSPPALRTQAVSSLPTRP